MAEIQLSVSPETLRQTAMEMMDLLRKVQLRATRIEDISKRTRAYWQGDAGTQDRAGYSECGTELREAARKLESRSITLMKMAGVYQELENAVGVSNMALKMDQILPR